MRKRMASVLCVVFLGFGLGYVVNGGYALSSQETLTHIQVGVMSAQQQEHSKLYGKYNSDRKLPDLVRREKGDDIWVSRLPPLGADLTGGSPLTTIELLNRGVCNAETIVVGIVKSKAAQLTEDQSFLFTDYVIEVGEVLKSTKSIVPGGDITVTRPGGEAILNGKKIRALDEGFRPLEIGHQYVLFLQFLPATRCYKPIETGESFALQGDTVKSLKDESLDRFGADYSPLSLISELRTAVTTPCDGKKGSGK